VGVEILMRHADSRRQEVAAEFVAAGSRGRADDQRLPRRIDRWPVIIWADQVHGVGSLRCCFHCHALLKLPWRNGASISANGRSGTFLERLPSVSIRPFQDRYPDLNFGAMRYKLRHTSAPEVECGA